MQLLPIVEMFCKYELQDDCSDLRALMLRFDSEKELQSHELGRALLSMIASEGDDLQCLPPSLPIPPRPNPFQGVRERLDLAALAIMDLNAQVTCHRVLRMYVPTCRIVCSKTVNTIHVLSCDTMACF